MNSVGQIAQSSPWWITVALPIVTFVLGFFASRFTLSKKERKDFEQANYANTVKLVEQDEAAYKDYTSALLVYCEATDVTFDMFTSIATKGDVYFYQARLTCDAIMSGKVDIQMRDNSLLPRIGDIAHKTLLQHYEALQAIAAKKGYPYNGELRRQDYVSIFAVAERFGLTAT